MFSFNIEKSTESTRFNDLIKWDMIIIGGGPAGLNAALYGKRKGLEVGIITKDIGGQLHNTSHVDNYLGYQMIEGKALSDTFLDHVQSLEVPIYKDIYVTKIEPISPDFHIHLSNDQVIHSKTILITTGGASKTLDIPGEKKYANKGVSYCTTCDAPFFKNKHVVVAGGGNSAAEAVIDLSAWAHKITLVHRSKWRADQVLLDKLHKIPQLEIKLNTQILEIYGKDSMTGLKILDKTTQSIENLDADGIFIEIGTIPKSQLVQPFVTLNEKNEIVVDNQQMTSYPGIFAAGDVTNQPFKQIIISVAEGAKAALSISNYLNHTYKGA